MDEMGGPVMPCMGPGFGMMAAALALASSLAMCSISSHGSNSSLEMLSTDGSMDASIQYASTTVWPDVGEDGAVDAGPVASLWRSSAMATGGCKGTMPMTSVFTCQLRDPCLPACIHSCWVSLLAVKFKI